MSIKYVFIDFDGCMHTYSSDARCDLAKNLKIIVKAFPDIKFVFSTSWSEYQPFERLLSYMPADIESYFVGNTTITKGYECKHVRYLECKEWLKHHDPECNDNEWIAIDDNSYLFPPECSNLFLCDPKIGFSEEVANQFVNVILEREIE